MGDDRKHMEIENKKNAMDNAITEYIVAAREAGFDNYDIHQELSDVFAQAAGDEFEIHVHVV